MGCRKGYFHRVHEQTPTRLWINNPTREEADFAIEARAISCTTNPTYAMKMIQREDENYVMNIVDESIKKYADDSEAADHVQQVLVKVIMDKFHPLHKKSPGKQGFVSIQGDPFADKDVDHIINEALRYRHLGDNFITKIPATETGIKALERLIPEDIPMIATEVMGISQMIYTCEMYKRISKECGKKPPFYVTHITGIFDEHLKNVVQRDGIDISSDLLWQAGCIVARKQYQLLKERGYPGIMLGGGARGVHHFTEMVGADMHITINWKGTADSLIKADPPIVYRMFNKAPQWVIDELLEKIPDFRKAYDEDGLSVDEFADFGPVQLFRDSFINGWVFLLDTIKKRRKVLV
jgi:transaldolase